MAHGRQEIALHFAGFLRLMLGFRQLRGALFHLAIKHPVRFPQLVVQLLEAGGEFGNLHWTDRPGVMRIHASAQGHQ